jgi:hypothetical protein
MKSSLVFIAVVALTEAVTVPVSPSNWFANCEETLAGTVPGIKPGP